MPAHTHAERGELPRSCGEVTVRPRAPRALLSTSGGLHGERARPAPRPSCRPPLECIECAGALDERADEAGLSSPLLTARSCVCGLPRCWWLPACAALPACDLSLLSAAATATPSTAGTRATTAAGTARATMAAGTPRAASASASACRSCSRSFSRSSSRSSLRSSPRRSYTKRRAGTPHHRTERDALLRAAEAEPPTAGRGLQRESRPPRLTSLTSSSSPPRCSPSCARPRASFPLSFV
jgi:hypothetical protein